MNNKYTKSYIIRCVIIIILCILLIIAAHVFDSKRHEGGTQEVIHNTKEDIEKFEKVFKNGVEENMNTNNTNENEENDE